MITLEYARDISLDRIKSLRNGFGQRALAWYNQINELGVKAYVYEGYRSFERQNELYSIGRTVEGKKVTNAEPGQSFHQYGLAFDWVPLIPSPKVNMYEADWNNIEGYSKGQELARTIGFRTLAWETPHLEDAGYKDWRELHEKFGKTDYEQWRC